MEGQNSRSLFFTSLVFGLLYLACGLRAGWFERNLLGICLVAMATAYSGFLLYPVINRAIKRPHLCATLTFSLVSLPWSVAFQPVWPLSRYVIALILSDLVIYAGLGCLSSMWVSMLSQRNRPALT